MDEEPSGPGTDAEALFGDIVGQVAAAKPVLERVDGDLGVDLLRLFHKRTVSSQIAVALGIQCFGKFRLVFLLQFFLRIAFQKSQHLSDPVLADCSELYVFCPIKFTKFS